MMMMMMMMRPLGRNRIPSPAFRKHEEKTAARKTGGKQDRPPVCARGETFGVALIEPDAFSRRAGEIIAKAVAPSDE
jgi:hypothetical protein